MNGIIKEKKVYLLAIPLPKPFHLSFGVLYDLPRVILVLTIETEHEEFQSIGESSIDFPFSHYDAWDIYNVLNNLPLEGKSVDDVEMILQSSWNDRLQDGCYSAQAALNMALDDARGKLLKKNVTDLYGRTRSGGTILQSVGLEPLPQLKETIKTICKKGRMPKIKCDQNVDDALMRIKIAQEITKSFKSSFSIDFNACLIMEQWEKLCDKINKQFSRISFFEQPVGGTVLETVFAHGISMQKTGIPTMADESFLTEEDARILGKANVFLNMKIQKLGGIRQAVLLEQEAIKARNGIVTSLVGGTFPTALGRAYDQHAVNILKSVTLPSDGLEPSTDWFSGEKHFIHEPFILTDDGKSKAFEKDGIGCTFFWEHISQYIVPDPKNEYFSIRTKGIGNYFHFTQNDPIKTYSEIYQSVTGKDPTWNISK